MSFNENVVIPTDDIEEELEESLNDDEYEGDNVAAIFNTSGESGWLPIVKEYMYWLRRYVSHVESVRTLCRMARRWATLDSLPTITINVLAVQDPGMYMEPWKDVIKEAWVEGEGNGKSWTAQQVIDQLGANGLYTANTEWRFFGTLHCEACLMSLLKNGALEKDIKAVSSLYFSIQQADVLDGCRRSVTK